MTAPRIDQILGAEQAAALIKDCAAGLAHQDHFDPGTALRLACERVADGDPLLLAAPGQVWALRDDVDLEDAPARQLKVHARSAWPPCVLVSDVDDPTGEIDELLLEVLEMYTLASWTSADVEVR